MGVSKVTRDAYLCSDLHIISFDIHERSRVHAWVCPKPTVKENSTCCNYKWFVHLGVSMNYDKIARKTHKQDTCKTLSHHRRDLNPVSVT